MNDIELDALRVVEINGRTYIGIVNETPRDEESGQNGSLTISDHVEGPLSNNNMKAYVKENNLGKLKEITFNGAGITYTARPLEVDKVDQFKVYIKAMKQIKADAMVMLENQYFDSAF